MGVGRVLHGDHVLALTAAEAELGDRLRRVVEKPVAVGGIAPGLGDDPGAVARADLRLVGLDEDVERGRIDVALLGQKRLERADAKLDLVEMRVLVVVIVDVL